MIPSAKRVAKKWKSLPKGWTEESVKKFWDSLTDRAPKHPVSRCIREMDGKVSNPGAFCGGLADQMIPGWREEAAKERKKKASTNVDLFFYKATDGKWYFDREDYEEDWDTGEQMEGEIRSYGPFLSLRAAMRWDDQNHPNAGGYSDDDSGTMKPPRNPINPRRRRWACGDGPCQCGGQCGCQKGQALSLQPDYGESDAALPRGASAARVASRYKLGADKKPPNLRKAKDPAKSCATCAAFDASRGVCTGYNDYKVKPTQTCDTWHD